MLKLRINPIVAKDLKDIRDHIAEDNELGLKPVSDLAHFHKKPVSNVREFYLKLCKR